MKSPFRSRLSIKWIMPPLMILPVIIVSAVLISLDYSTSRSSIDDLADRNMQEIHSNIAQHLSYLMELPPAINALNRRMIDSGELSLTDMARNREPMFHTLSTFPTVSSIVIGSADDRATWVIRYPYETNYEYALKTTPQSNMEEHTLAADGNITGPLLASYDYRPTVRPWYKTAVKRRRSHLGRCPLRFVPVSGVFLHRALLRRTDLLSRSSGPRRHQYRNHPLRHLGFPGTPPRR